MELENIGATSLARTCNPGPLAKQGALPTTPRPQNGSSRQQPPASDVIDLPRRRPAQLPQVCSVEQAPKQALCTRHLRSTGAPGRVSSVCLHDRETGRQAAAEAHILKVKVLVVGAVLDRKRVRLIHADCRRRSKLPPYKQKTVGALACAGYQGAMHNQTSCGMQTGQMQTGQLQGARCRACTMLCSTCKHRTVLVDVQQARLAACRSQLSRQPATRNCGAQPPQNSPSSSAQAPRTRPHFSTGRAPRGQGAHCSRAARHRPSGCAPRPPCTWGQHTDALAHTCYKLTRRATPEPGSPPRRRT